MSDESVKPMQCCEWTCEVSVANTTYCVFVIYCPVCLVDVVMAWEEQGHSCACIVKFNG